MAPTPQLGARIRRRRESLGLSQREVAEKVGTDRANITRIEGGLVSPTWVTVEKIARALKTTPSDLIAA